MQDIDSLLPRGPKWRIKTFEVVGSNGTEIVDFWVRDTLEGVRDKLYDSQFQDHLHFRPEAHWTCPERVTRKWGETWAARHVWRLQVRRNNTHTLVKLTRFGSLGRHP